ncbi:MAG: tetratricopeptide repeat protein [Micavibrio sp.]
MTSGKDDHDDLDLDQDFEQDMTLEPDVDDVLDAGGIDEPLSAGPLRSSYDDFDDGQDDHGSEVAADDADDIYADEEPAPRKKSGGGLAKIVGPLLVLAVAGGAGAYIVMNPSLLNQLMGTSTAIKPAAVAATIDLPGEGMMPTPPADVAQNNEPPQPLANVNEMPQAEAPPMPDMPIIAEEIVADVSVADVSVADAPVSDMPVTSDAGIPVEPAIADVVPEVQQDTREAVMGSDVAVTPEALALDGSADVAPADVVPADVVPDQAVVEPPVEQPAAEQDAVAEATPDVVPTAPAEPPVETPDVAAVTEPTFVPAAPDIPDVTSELPVAETAVPPVMNVQELQNQAPTTPRTVTQVDPMAASPEAVAGVSSAPAATAPASNVYYDSLSQVPTGAMATGVGPRELNPTLEPASKMIIVNKESEEKSQESMLVSANRALKLKRYDSALEIFDQLYAKNNRDVRILMGRAVAQQNMGLSESAIQSYEEVLNLKPNHTEALINMMGLVRSQYPEIALRRLLELYAKHPGNASIAAQIGVTNADLGHFDDALRYLGIASTIEPGNAQHIFNMAIAADRMGNKAEAVRLYERALEIDVVNGGGNSVPREKIYDRLSVLRRG